MMLQPHQEIDQVMGSSCELMTQIIKGKRTKRPRTLSEEKIESIDNNNNNNNNNLSSPSSSIEFAGGVEEEEDMANCLILLAQGTQHKTRKPTTTTTKGTCSGPSYVYQCKTCNRCFSSFQALGGHRASHKKPNNKIGIIIEEKQEEEAQVVNNDHMNTTLSLQIPNRGSYGNSTSTSTKSNKVHECSICGAEFSSGQALGGHMRRHRAAFATTSTPSPPTTVSLVTSSPEYQETKKVKRNSLQLDLNLPAPEDHDHRDSKLHFASKEQVLVFSASSLVDCHY